MNELDLLIEKHYQKRSKEKFNADDLIKLVEQTLDRVYDATLGSAELKEEAAPGLNNVSSKTAKEFLLSLPKFGPNESWGRPGSVDRETMNKVFGVIGGEATIEAKISFLGRIVDETNQITSPRRIIGSLILLESLSTIITTFSAAPAGFVFEGYIAALLRGTQEADVSEKGNLPIQDLIAFDDIKGHEGTPVSLKLLSPTTPIHGSYTNLVDSMDEFGKMVYLIARKVGDRIVLEEFTLTQDNFIDAISFTATGKRKKAKSLFRLGQYPPEKSIQILNKTKSWPEKYALLSRTAGYTGTPIARPSKQVKKPAEKESPKLKLGELPAEYVPPQVGDEDEEEPINESSTESRKQTLLKEGGDKTQWSISDKQLPKLVNYVDVSYKELGSLPVSAKEIEKVAEREMQKLNDSLLELFTATKSLSDNINDYFTVEKRNSAIKSGNKAIGDTVQIQKSMRAEILKDDKK